ncbi:TBC domain containing protein [Tritrichomonas foetus]|uniref:TBC domain containing protein n=1 Tax=Tritrichomonas foetus TaxID=1144522 RepID=A0A1J4JZ12_9EUKA|nr:TBC domain containing protein [Tritrichomonas foetus]|eukprot:OHT03930.1 TBC domain containing protein [Tritrichomonas foetus]
MSSQKPSFFHRISKSSNKFDTKPKTSSTISKENTVGSSILTPNGSEYETSAREKRTRLFQGILSERVVNLEKLKSLSWAGVPDQFRADVWRLFLDYMPINSVNRDSSLSHKRSDYFDCAERLFGESQRNLWTNAQKQTELQILRDLPRTHINILRNEQVQKLFLRVLFVWAVRHPASGYVQGMNDLLQPFFFTFALSYSQHKNIDEFVLLNELDVSDDDMKSVEADCFWCFSKLLDGLQDLYTKDQPGLYKMLEHLHQVLLKVDPVLAKWIDDEDIQYQEFAFRWMNCLLVREFSPQVLFRLWDTYLGNHTKIAQTHVFVCAAFLNLLHQRLVGKPHSEFVMEIQMIEPNTWQMTDMEVILAQEYVYEKTYCQSQQSIMKTSASMPILKR